LGTGSKRFFELEKYWAWMLIDIATGNPSEGIWPRMPSIWGWLSVSQTLTVAHSALDRVAPLIAVWIWAALGRGWPAEASAEAAPASTTSEKIKPLGRMRTGAKYCAPRVWYPCPVAATSEDTIALLAQVPAFSTLGEPELARVADVTVPRQFGPGEVVFREGDQSDTCYIVRSGSARALREHPDGRSITLATFGPGDIFGELAMFDDERRSATVESVQETELIAILGSDMRRLLREHADISVKLMAALGRRLRETNERLARQSFQTVQSRVATVLVELVQAARNGGAGDRDVLITSTQAELAQLAGSSRESASRFLAVLERAGIITQGRGRLTVHDPAALERYVY